jgi:hypothetical protein
MAVSVLVDMIVAVVVRMRMIIFMTVVMIMMMVIVAMVRRMRMRVLMSVRSIVCVAVAFGLVLMNMMLAILVLLMSVFVFVRHRNSLAFWFFLRQVIAESPIPSRHRESLSKLCSETGNSSVKVAQTRIAQNRIVVGVGFLIVQSLAIPRAVLLAR